MKLYRAFATVGGMTLISRVLGFARDMLIAGVLGTGIVADAFFVAFRFPNLFRRLFAEGAFNSAFVPLFAKKLEGDGATAARRFAEEALAVLLFALLVLTAFAELTMPWLMYGLAPGFSDHPEKFDLTILMTRIAFPYLLCMSVVALLSGVLNSLQRYTAAAAAPILLNIVLICVMLAAGYLGLDNGEAGILLVWGVAAAGGLQLLMLAIAAYRAGIGLGFRLPRLTPDVRRLLSLGVPGVIAGGITQINIAVGTIIASLEAGAVSYLYYADRIYQLPLGVVGIAIGVVLLPDISRKLRAGDMMAVQDSQNRALEFALLLTVPAAVALVVMAEPICRVLYERGAFTVRDAQATAWALGAFAAGLPSFVLIKVFQPAFFAREDTKTPMWFAMINLIINAGGSVALFYALKSAGYAPHTGIAVATTVSGWINALMLWGTLKKRGHFALDARMRRVLPMLVLSSLVMGAALWFAVEAAAPFVARPYLTPVRVGVLGGLVALGGAVFGVTAIVTGALNLRGFLGAFRRRAKG
jgi:putative peptidoglycan lipid II flippase